MSIFFLSIFLIILSGNSLGILENVVIISSQSSGFSSEYSLISLKKYRMLKLIQNYNNSVYLLERWQWNFGKHPANLSWLPQFFLTATSYIHVKKTWCPPYGRVTVTAYALQGPVSIIRCLWYVIKWTLLTSCQTFLSLNCHLNLSLTITLTPYKYYII